ncbi:hypothetical protein ACFQQB_37750 [Nonomuraea rubra]|uniref:hypothetical protein n=1 Tax=Nonomuraea rubra TaxID=46180 RepID=UPI0036088F23
MVRWAEKSELPALVAIELAADGLFEQVGIVFPPGTTQIEEVHDPAAVLVEGSRRPGSRWSAGWTATCTWNSSPSGRTACGRGSAGG